MIKASASPVVLISLGIFLYRKIEYKNIWGNVLLISVLKMLALPAIFYLWGKISGHLDTFSISVMMAGLPPAVTSFALSDRYPMNKQLVVSVIFLNTILSLALFPLLVRLL